MTRKQTQLLGCTFDFNTKPDKKLATKASLTPIYATNTYLLTHVGTYYILCGMYLVLKTWMIICSNVRPNFLCIDYGIKNVEKVEFSSTGSNDSEFGLQKNNKTTYIPFCC